jgi:hypothetical protein
MKHFCEHYIPNNSDFIFAGCCTLNNEKCPFASKFPVVGVELTATNQKDCTNYKEWQDPLA